MILIFPDPETLRLALTTGAIPQAISRTAAVAGHDDRGRLYVEPSQSLPRASLSELRRLGADSARGCEVALTEHVYCWPQLLPLRRDERTSARPEQTPVLFDLQAQLLGTVATEILRLGNDRQSFRVLTATEQDGERVLLRVVGPPYYTLLRAIENGATAQPTAYVECAPRVWVQVGYRHPLGEHFKVSAGKLLLMQPPRRWTFLDEAPFHDIYEVLDFALPDVATEWREGELGERLRVPLRLAHSGGTEAAELWVVRDEPMAQLDQLVQSADDQLLSRLAFAVGRNGEQTIVVLRARPSKSPPPVLIINAIAFRPYLKLPNLFLPCGTRLHPPLRRDAVRDRLADDPAVITWLQPQHTNRFTSESLPDQAFRPLGEWVEYVLEHERQSLEQWVQSTLFDFEPFICKDDSTPKPRKKPTPEHRRAPPVEPSLLKGKSQERTRSETPSKAVEPEEETTPFAVPVQPNKLRKRLDALEARFLAAAGSIDAPERQALWPELAELNAALGSDDAVVCWLHTLWTRNGNEAKGASRWARMETALAHQHLEARAALGREPVRLADGRDNETALAELDRLFALSDPTTAEARGLAAYLFQAASRPKPPPALAERLNPARQFLEAHDRLLPVRAAWLAWTSVAQLAGGDVLALARARDRLLERLYQNGLRPEQELPSFLRLGGKANTHGFRAIGPWLLNLRELAERCCQRMDKGRLIQIDRSQTPACLDLVFAFGLARLGESEAAPRLQQRAALQLDTGDAFHEFVRRAFDYRIAQARGGLPPTGALPDELLAAVVQKAPSERLPYDRLRETSRIIEPHQGVRWDREFLAGDPLAKELARLPNLPRHEFAGKSRQLLKEHSSEPVVTARVLAAVLEQAPRLGEEFAVAVLHQAVPVYDTLPAADDKLKGARAELLEKALIVAAHFDAAEPVQALVSRFQKLLRAEHETNGPHTFTSLAGQCLRGLRKLGLRQEIEWLLRQMEELLLAGKKPGELNPADVEGRGEILQALLHLAAGWYYFGRDQDAEIIINLARGVLLSGPLRTGWHPKGRADLACAYAAALSCAPLEFAQQRFVEMFQKLDSVATSWHTTPGYCALQVRVVEAVVLAVISDDFTQGTELRRWLDDDEYLIRKRIHEDLRAMMGTGEPAA
jgi:hypothetical protein